MQYFFYWGKTDDSQNGNPTLFHRLPYHCWDVVIAMMVLLDRGGPRLSALFPLASRPFCLFAGACHDLGKLSVLFQNKSPDLYLVSENVGFPFFGRCPPIYPYYHNVATAFWFAKENSDYGLPARGNFLKYIETAAEHHGVDVLGYRNNCQVAGVPKEIREYDRLSRVQFMQENMRLFLEGVDPSNAPPPPRHLSGLISIADWIVSEFVPEFNLPPMSPQQYLQKVRPSIESAIEDTGILHRPVLNYGMKGLYPHLEPRGIQKIVDKVDLRTSMLIILEASGGSGKTEAANALASRALHLGLADNIIHSLPTQMMVNMMGDRASIAGKNETLSLANRIWGPRPNISFAHKKSKKHITNIQHLKNFYRQKDITEFLPQCTKWLWDGRRKNPFAQYGFVTIDQLEIASLPVRYRSVRRLALARSVIIVDEVHGCDKYMMKLLIRTLRPIIEDGGIVILLSATLSERQKEMLLNEICGGLK